MFLWNSRIRERPLTCTSNNLIKIVCNPPPMSSCVGDAHAFGSKCYHLFNSPSKTFQAAQLDCRSKGGILAEINSAQENNFISETLLYQNSSMTDFWTGKAQYLLSTFWKLMSWQTIISKSTDSALFLRKSSQKVNWQGKDDGGVLFSRNLW